MSAKQLPDGTWFFRFQSGKRAHRQQGFRTRVEAEKAETMKKAEAIRRAATSSEVNDHLTLAEAADTFFEEYSRPFKRTWMSDRAHIRTIKTFFGNKKIRDIRPRDVEAFRAFVLRTVKNRRGEAIKLHTVNHHHKDLKAIINWAKKKRLYSGENPAWGVDMARVPRARVRFLLQEEERRLTPVVAKRARLWPYYVIALHTGMRLGEITAIRVKDIYLHPNPMIFIPNSKTSRSRHVPLHGLALDVVKERMKGKVPESVLLEVYQGRTISDWFREACLEAYVENFTFHCLRHTFAGHMLSKGVAIYHVSKILGHSGIAVTEQHYGHMDKSVFSRDIHNIGDVITVPPIEGLALQMANSSRP